MVIGGASPEGIAIPELGVTPPDDSGTDLEDELLNISPLPTIVSPLTKPVEALPVSPSLYQEPPVPAQPDPVSSVESQVIPLRGAVERPTLDFPSFPSFLISPAQSYYDRVTSPITPDGDLLLKNSSDLPLLSLLLLPIPVADVSVPVSAVTHSVWEPVLVPSVVPPDLSREGSFDVDQDTSGSGATPRVLESLPYN